MRISNMHCEECKKICPTEKGAEREWLMLLGFPCEDGVRRNISYCPEHIPQNFQAPENYQWPLKKAKKIVEKIKDLYQFYVYGGPKDSIKPRHIKVLKEIIQQHPNESFVRYDAVRIYLGIGEALVATNQITQTGSDFLYDHRNDSGGTRPAPALPEFNLGAEQGAESPEGHSHSSC